MLHYTCCEPVHLADVNQSAFAPLPIINASISSTPSAELVSVDLELNTTAEANELISKYDGQIADGNKLSVTIIRQSLKDRMGSGQGQAQSQSAGRQEVGSSASRQGSGRGQELLDTSSSGSVPLISIHTWHQC